MTLYAIGDIHGQLAKLQEVLAWIGADGGPDARVVFLGDYVDRGPDSAGVLDLLCDAQDAGRNWVILKGNHDRLFEWFMEDPPRHDPHLLVGYHWLHPALGGVETLASYGVTFEERTRLQVVRAMAGGAVPQRHVDLMRQMPLYHEEAGYLFVHAGIRPGVPLAEQTDEDLVWIRQEFHQATDPHPWVIVHGHTPVEAAVQYSNRVNLDSGAGYGRALSVGVFEAGETWLLTDKGRVPMPRSA